MTNTEACELEIVLIAKHKDSLCNIASGGESGLVGVSLSKSHKEKLRQRKLGRNQSPDHAAKSARAKLGKKQPRCAVEKTRAAKSKSVIDSNGVVYRSTSQAARTLSKQFGVNCSQSNISSCARGDRNEAYGRAWSYNTSDVPRKPTGVTSSMMRIKCSNGMIFDSVQEAKKWVISWRGDAKNQPISACARGETKSSYGHRWEYV